MILVCVLITVVCSATDLDSLSLWHSGTDITGRFIGFLQTESNSKSLTESFGLENLLAFVDSQKSYYETLIKDKEDAISGFRAKIDEITPLQEDAETYVPEKEQEMEQAKRWAEIALREIKHEKQRFAERDHRIQNNIKNMEDAILLLHGSELVPLLEELKAEIESSRELNRKNHEQALAGAKAYGEEKEYTYENLTRQDNLILRNQIMLQEEMYYYQSRIDQLQATIDDAKETLALMTEWSDAQINLLKI